MDLMHNATFRIPKQSESSVYFAPGIYRVIVDQPAAETTVAVLVQPEDESTRSRGGRKKKKVTKSKRKKPPPPLVGTLRWLDRKELEKLSDLKLLQMITIERESAVHNLRLRTRAEAEFEKRKKAAKVFLDYDGLSRHILEFKDIAGLIRDAMAAATISKSAAYKVWSLLCRHGFDEKSLVPRHDRAGAPGVARRCDPGDPGGRKKAGRKTLKQRTAKKFGVDLEPDQPGMSSEWAAAVKVADKQIPNPKPSWPKRCEQIVASAFVGSAKEVGGRIEIVKPALGAYPNNRQIRRLLETETDRIARIIERTTKRHFERAKRGLIARNWEGVSGPGWGWLIDSTVGDLYLRSSLNRAWIVGRPIVYIIVDVWSTAVVGFYVCLTGPSWSTAKVALFNASADPALIADFWGYVPIDSLVPYPTMAFSLLCDRGEYLSQAHRETALKLIPLTSYTRPYAGDLKGLVEVLHRIEKDQQVIFVPGAFDFRRQELELRKVNPENCVMTVREYVQYLYELFSLYNLTADRTHRIDPFMQAAGVFPSPAGLWHWGHEVGIGFRRYVEPYDLISNLLPSATGRIRRDAVRHAGNDYMSEEIKAEQWTAIARNGSGWDVPLNYYPGSFSRIWTPRPGRAGAHELQLSDQSRASPDLTMEDWMDSEALRIINNPKVEHLCMMDAVDSIARMRAIVDGAKALTAEAIAKASGTKPTMSEARTLEVAAAAGASASETKVAEKLRDDAIEEHQRMLDSLLQSSNATEDRHGRA